MTLAQFLQQKPYLFWYVKDKKNISPEAAVEAVLNYGDWSDVQTLMRIIGQEQMAKIFFNQIKNKKRVNYHHKTRNYFNLYFAKYASGNLR